MSTHTTTRATVHPRTPPRARPGAAGLGAVLALLLVGLAVVAVHDLAVSQGWSSDQGWTSSVVDAVDGLTATTGLVVAGAAALVVGLVVIITALKPARRTHLRVAADADVWVSPGAVAALARAVADRAPGVISAETTRATRRQVVVEVVTQDDRAAVTEAVRSALDDTVTGLTPATITVKATELPSESLR